MIKSGVYLRETFLGYTALDWAVMRKDKDVFEFLVKESRKSKMKFNQFTIAKAIKLGCNEKFVAIIKKYAKFIRD